MGMDTDIIQEGAHIQISRKKFSPPQEEITFTSEESDFAMIQLGTFSADFQQIKHKSRHIVDEGTIFVAVNVFDWIGKMLYCITSGLLANASGLQMLQHKAVKCWPIMPNPSRS